MSDHLYNDEYEEIVNKLNWEKEKTSRLEERLLSKETLISQMRLYNNDLCETIQQSSIEMEDLKELQEKDLLEIEALEEMIREQRYDVIDKDPEELEKENIDIDSIMSDYEFLHKENEKLKKQNRKLLSNLESQELVKEEVESDKEDNLELEEKIIDMETEISNARTRNDTLKKDFYTLKEEVRLIETEKELIAIRFQEQMKEQCFDKSSLLEKLMKMKEESLIRTQSQTKRVDREIEAMKKELLNLKTN